MKWFGVITFFFGGGTGRLTTRHVNLGPLLEPVGRIISFGSTLGLDSTGLDSTFDSDSTASGKMPDKVSDSTASGKIPDKVMGLSKSFKRWNWLLICVC